MMMALKHRFGWAGVCLLVFTLKAYSVDAEVVKEDHRGIRVCGEIIKSYLVKTKGDSSIQLYKGEIVEIIDRSKVKVEVKGKQKVLKTYTVKFGAYRSFRVPKKRVRLTVSPICSLNGKRILVKGSSLGYSEPESTLEAGRLVEGGEYTAVSFFAGKATDWYRVALENQLVFMPKSNINLTYSKAEAIVQKKGFYNTLGFHLSLEGGVLFGQNKKILDPLIVSVQPNDITTDLQSPLYISSFPGNGFFIGGYHYKKIDAKMNLLIRLGYQQANYEITGYDNPEHSIDVRLNQLDAKVSKSLGYKAIYLSLGPSWTKRYWQNVFKISLLANLNYNYERDFLTLYKACNGVCLGKREPLDIDLDLKEQEIRAVIRTEWVLNSFNLSFSVDDQLGMAVSASYQIW